MREVLSVDKVIGLARAGETFTLEAGGCPTGDLLTIASLAARSGARVRFRGLQDRPLEDLMRITVASEGQVVLEPATPPAPAMPPRTGWLRRRPAFRPAHRLGTDRAA